MGQSYTGLDTAAVLGGDPPDVWHTSSPPRVTAERGLIVPLPNDAMQYVKRNYVPGAVDRVTLGGKLRGYPTEFQASVHVYRKSFYRDVGLGKPPATTEDVFEHAVKLTRKSGATYERFGFVLRDDRWLNSELPNLIARFGDQMYHFRGDKPLKADVASAQAMDAVGW